MFPISWLLKSVCGTGQFMLVLIKVLRFKCHDSPSDSTEPQKPAAVTFLLGTCQMDQMFQCWVCLLKADTDSGMGKHQTKEKLLLKPEILSLLQQRALSSPAGQWQLLVLAVLLCHPELVPELPLCSLHWVFSLPAVVSEHLSCSCWMFATSLLFPVPAGRVFPHPFRLCAETFQQCSRHPAQEHLTLCHLSN